MQKYGQFCYSLWEEAKKLEVQRIHSIKKAFEQYYFKHKATFGQQELVDKTITEVNKAFYNLDL